MRIDHSADAAEQARPEPVRQHRAARLVGIDAARGVAIVAIICVHILPAYYPNSGSQTLTWIFFPGDSPALFALLAGTGLAFTSGGRRPSQGRAMTAARVGIVVRSLLLLALGLSIGYLMPDEAPAYNILMYFAMYFLFAIPFLGLRPKTLFVLGGAFLAIGPTLRFAIRDALPAWSAHNPTLAVVADDPAAFFWQLVLTGTYPTLPYMAYVLVGLGIGRLDLADQRIQVRLLLAGTGLALFTKLLSWHLLYTADVYTTLLNSAPGLTAPELKAIMIWGPPSGFRSSSAWWLVLTTPDLNTPFSVAWSLGVGLAVVGAVQLLARRFEKWMLPFAAMGGMSLTLYYAHLVFLSFELHYTYRALWCAASVLLSVLFSVLWLRRIGVGPLERVMNTVVRPVRRAVLGRHREQGAGIRPDPDTAPRTAEERIAEPAADLPEERGAEKYAEPLEDRTAEPEVRPPGGSRA